MEHLINWRQFPFIEISFYHLCLQVGMSLYFFVAEYVFNINIMLEKISGNKGKPMARQRVCFRAHKCNVKISL